MFDDADLIHSYSRRQAIANGVLIDVTAAAREAGIRFPTALTAAAWVKCVKVPEAAGLVLAGDALGDLVWMFRLAARNAGGPTLSYGVHVRNDDRPGAPALVRLKAVCGPGDDAEPVITIMAPDED